jgi:hypothetical protein
MPKSNKVKSSKAKSVKAARPTKSKAAATKAKPAKVEAKSSKPEVRLPEAAAAAPAQQVTPDNLPVKPKVEPPHPGKQEQPMWTRFNQGHNQKMPRGRVFRHQGR